MVVSAFEWVKTYTQNPRQARNVKSLNNRGYSHAKLGNFTAAIEDYTAVLRPSTGVTRS